MVLHIILRHFKGKIVVCSRCQLLISIINVSSKIKIYFFIYFFFFFVFAKINFCEGSLLLKIYLIIQQSNHTTADLINQ